MHRVCCARTGACSCEMKLYGRVFALAIFVGILEICGGCWSGSLALYADAFHALLDGGAGALAVFIAWLAQSRAGAGEERIRRLGAYGQGTLLVIAALWIGLEAYERWQAPRAVHGGSMLVVAIVGGIGNLLQHTLLERGEHRNQTHVNLHRHVMSDLVLSGCVVVGAITISITRLVWIDPALSIAAAIYIGYQAVKTFRGATPTGGG